VRLTIVTNVPAPYRIPLYERIDDLLRDRGGKLTVIYGARNLPARKSAYATRGRQWEGGELPTGRVDSLFLADRPLTIAGRETYADPRVVRRLAAARPDVVIAGGFAPWIFFVAGWCVARRRPYLIWSGETVATARRHSYGSARRIPLCRAASGFVAYGPAAAEYLRSLGAGEPVTTVVGNGIDIGAFARAAEAARAERRALRRRFGLQGQVILSVGGKNVDLVVEAARSLPDTTVAVAGVEPPAPLPDGVVALGRLRRGEMPGVYVAADCVAHPVIDRWPHAINEALAAGTPVVASPDTGVPDEMLTGPGCEIVRWDPTALSAAFARSLAVSRETSPAIREAIRKPLERWDVGRMAERFVEAAGAAADRSRRRVDGRPVP
jgi:glycosyltransferase involved in cell wall biosynthesis